VRVQHLFCGPFANVSEETACNAMAKHFQALPGDATVYLLTNLAHSVDQRRQPDEIDMVAIGPGGLVVVEVKHWDRARLKSNAWDVEDQADLVTLKAKRIAGRLRKVHENLGFVGAAMLLTKEAKSLRQDGRLPDVRGVRLYALADAGALAGTVIAGSGPGLDAQQVARELAPRSLAAASGEIRRIGRITELNRLSPPEDRFRRVYRGRDAPNGDRLLVYLFDLSASPHSNAEVLARREFEAVQRLQKSPVLPSLVDSFQPVPGYPGELFFFTLADSAAAPVAETASDPEWTVPARIAFAATALRALAELQSPSGPAGQAVIHRGLTPDSVQVRADGRPLFAGWRWARLPQAQTITGATAPEVLDHYAAPEVRQGGLAVADVRSDVYSLCRVLSELFTETDPQGRYAKLALSSGLNDDPAKRSTATDIAGALEGLVVPAVPPQPPATPQHWDEGFIFAWERERYRVVLRLGEGGTGRTFKLEQLDGTSDEPIGTFVGKVVMSAEVGPAVLDAYRKIRSIADHPGLSGVFQTAAEWRADTLVALLRFRKGDPLDSLRGDTLVPYAELFEGTASDAAETLLLRWAADACLALDVLHAQGWVHGDVSPSNILVDDDRLTLIDYDLAGPAGTVARGPGTVPYASPERRANRPAQPSDDLFALAASLFHVLTDRLPFLFSGERRDHAGLAWADDEQAVYPRLAPFLNRATDPDPARRFGTAGDALRELRTLCGATPAQELGHATKEVPLPEPLRPNVVARVREILRSYPGSRFGNAETRGLDSNFAYDTYVETGLDRMLPDAVREGRVSLIILCGNAGDGKTAFLQHLASGLGIASLPSEQRVWDGMVGSLTLKVNLDGAAAWKGRSADELLDELFDPFQDGAPKPGRVHLVAVNDGRLMEWIESYEGRHGQTKLTHQLAEAIGRDGDGLDTHIRLIELNLRSLVGGLDPVAGRISTEFVDRMITRLVGGDDAKRIWAPCHTCSARMRCSIRVSAEMMGATDDAEALSRGALLRHRLTAALQAVHQSNEVHITARELKAALSYILFGVQSCEDLHTNVDLRPHVPADFAFDPRSERRQGELLRELTRLDPALEANARVDRYLTRRSAPDPAHGAPRYPDTALGTARRRAYFEWTDDQIEQVGGDRFALTLNGGRHFNVFREFPLLPPEKQREICDALCRGLSRLELLPAIALVQESVIPVRIVPRTPTETAFWADKPLDRFTLEAERFASGQGLETLHRSLTLRYQAASGWTEDLAVSLELFALLMELAEGGQILDAFSDDVFANLSVFTQRLVQEDERSLRAWNPADEERTYSIGIEYRDAHQMIVLRPVMTAVGS
jgi:serine/threonine protein kinase